MFTIMIDVSYKTMVELTGIPNPDLSKMDEGLNFPALEKMLVESGLSLKTILNQKGTVLHITRGDDWESMKQKVDEARVNNII